MINHSPQYFSAAVEDQDWKYKFSKVLLHIFAKADRATRLSSTVLYESRHIGLNAGESLEMTIAVSRPISFVQVAVRLGPLAYMHTGSSKKTFYFP